MEKKGVVLYYPTGIVHMRNLELLRDQLPGFRFLVIVEPWMAETANDVLNRIDTEDRVIIENNRLPQGVWEKGVNLLFLSMAYPNPFRLHLVYEAASREIPVIAIEEVNQLALNDGIINHYFLPIDYLAVPSEVEKSKFIDLGVNSERITVIGWPFYDDKAALRSRNQYDIRSQYKIRPEKKICLLVLGSLKEQDIVSIETSKIRTHIIETTVNGLSENFQLFIKPHPVETEDTLEEIRKLAPSAVILNPKFPIEPLIDQVDIVVNRGNSQVILLALLQLKSIIVVPAGLKTIFHSAHKAVIAESAQQFHRILVEYSRGKHPDYREILNSHFPIDHRLSLQKASQFFASALKEKCTGSFEKKMYVAILYAFLGDISSANQILDSLTERESVILLKKLVNRKISIVEFVNLLPFFTGKIITWHIQALFLRMLFSGSAKHNWILAAPLLKGFDGDVNPHYFIDDILKRIELEYLAGNTESAEKLIHKIYDDFSIFPFYHQAFDMLKYVYGRKDKSPSFRKTLWLLKNFFKPYARHCIKNKFIKR